jgi:hypothetical protein
MNALGNDIYLQQALPQQEVLEGFTKFVRQSWLQLKYHRSAKSMCHPLVVVAFGPRYSRKARSQDDIDAYHNLNHELISIGAMDFAVAGWLHTEYGLTFTRDMLPGYDDDITSTYGRQSHYHIRDNAIVRDTLNHQLWEEEWLE